MLRVLHSADWHLGASFHTLSLVSEQREFLKWLLTTIIDKNVNVLVVAGDVYDVAQPSAEASKLYFDFLAQLEERAPNVEVVIVGGNHDSMSRLDASAGLLAGLSIHVVGGLTGPLDEQAIERMLVPIYGDGGELAAVIAAVPYIHENRLGVRVDPENPGRLGQDIQRAVTELYDRLAAAARERFGAEVPLLATGHLTVASEEQAAVPEDSPLAIHQIGTIGALPATIFGDAWASVLLGHIHRPYPVVSPTVWYSGTPVALNPREAQTPRSVRLLDIWPRTPGEAPPEGLAKPPHEVPSAWLINTLVQTPKLRSMYHFEGTLEEILQAARTADWQGEFPPYVTARRLAKEWSATLIEELTRELSEIETPAGNLIVARAIPGLLYGEADPSESEELPRLDDLSEEEVFKYIYRSVHGDTEPSDELMGAFRVLLTQEDNE